MIVNVENVAQAGVHPARLDLGDEADGAKFFWITAPPTVSPICRKG